MIRWIERLFERFVDWIEGCEHCGSHRKVQPECSRTMYHWDGKGEDPNRDVRLCRLCARDHHEYWDEMWAMVTS